MDLPPDFTRMSAEQIRAWRLMRDPDIRKMVWNVGLRIGLLPKALIA